MKDSEVIVTTIKNVTQMIDAGNQNAILSLGIRGASQAKILAPKDTSQLANSIQYQTGVGLSGGFNDSPGKKADDKLSVALKKNEGAVGATAKHAPYPEFGTRFQAPQVYMRSSLALIAGDAPNVVKDKMDAELKLGALKYGQQRTVF